MADGGSTPGQAQQNVNVAVRGRPPRTVEIDSSERPGSRPGSKPAECVTIGKDGDVQVGKHKKDAMHIVPRTAPRFTFDVAFGSKCSQQEVFDLPGSSKTSTRAPADNASILAYGQTGSGKTYTMGTSSTALQLPAQHGVVPRAFRRIFEIIAEKTEKAEAAAVEPGSTLFGLPPPTFEVRGSFVEVHDDAVKDLLATPTAPGTVGADGEELTRADEVLIRENAKAEVVLVGVVEEECSNANELVALLERGTVARTVASTRMNAVSSRSHAVFTVVIEQRRPKRSSAEAAAAAAAAASAPGAANKQDGAVKVRAERVRAKLQLVDLAGSERNKRTQTTGQHFKESVNINQGLLALANVINVLSDMSDSQKQGGGGSDTGTHHVPYRDHKLTRLLRNSLGGNAATYMIACISTCADDFQETLNTLRYAARARNIQNTPTVNAEEEGGGGEAAAAAGREMARMEREMEALRAELAARRGGPEGSSPARVSAQLEAEKEKNAALAAKMAELQAVLAAKGADKTVGCGEERCLARLAETEAELEEARLGLKKDEEMFAALSVEIEELALTNFKLREELDQLKDLELAKPNGRSTGVADCAGPRSEALKELEAEEANGLEPSTAMEMDDIEAAAEMLGADAVAELRREQARLSEGQRKVKRAERASTEAAGKFIIQRNLLDKRLAAMEATMKEREALIADLQADREQQAAKQAQYTSKLARMREQIASRESTLADLKAQRCKTEDEKRQVTERYRQVQAELHDMRERVRQGEGAIKRMRGADRKIAGLGAELERMRADQAALQAKLKVEETKEKERERARDDEVRRLKGLTDGSQKMVRKLKQQMAEQAAMLKAKQAELDAARKGAASLSSQSNMEDGSSRKVPSAELQAVDPRLRASVRSIKKSLLRGLDASSRHAEAERLAAATKEKLDNLRAERTKQAAHLKGLELRAARPRSARQPSGEQAAVEMRELSEAVEDLDAEIGYVEQEAAGLQNKIAKHVAAGQVAPVSIDRLGLPEARGLVAELLSTIRTDKAALAVLEAGRAEAEASAQAARQAADRARGEAQLAEMEANRRLEEQRRENEYKLLAAYQKIDRAEAAAATGPKNGGAGAQQSATTGDAKWKDDQIAILTEHNTIYKKRVKELTRRLREASSLAHTQPDTLAEQVQQQRLHDIKQNRRRSPLPEDTRPRSAGADAAVFAKDSYGPTTPVQPPHRPASRTSPVPPAQAFGPQTPQLNSRGNGSGAGGTRSRSRPSRSPPSGGKAIDIAAAVAASPSLSSLGSNAEEGGVASVGSSATNVGAFMSREEHERRKRERAARHDMLRKEASKGWKSSARTDDPIASGWKQQRQKATSSKNNSTHNGH